MIPSQRCIDLIKQFEGFYSNAYLCPASVETIGFGTIRYSNGVKVKLGDKITIEDAEKELLHELQKFSNKIIANINQNQFDSLCSFAYNLGINALLNSTLYKKVKANPSDITIEYEFMKWNKARVKGVLTELKGLTRRRKAEAKLYYDKI